MNKKKNDFKTWLRWNIDGINSYDYNQALKEFGLNKPNRGLYAVKKAKLN